MLTTFVADSVVLAIPMAGPVAIPTATLWGFLSQVLSGFAIAFFVWWLARGRIRTERWQEQQIKAYHEVVNALYTIQEYTGPHAEEEEREDNGDPRIRSDAVLEAHRPEVDAAIRVVSRQAAVGPFLLTASANEILRTYEQRRNDPNWTGSTTPMRSWNWLARECWAEFADRARRDLGQMGFIRYWSKVGIRWPAKARRWFMAEPRSKLDYTLWKLKKRWEEWRHTRTP